MSSGDTHEPDTPVQPSRLQRVRLSAVVWSFVAAVIVVLILAGTTAAFALTQSLKIQRPPVSAPRFDRVFSPVCGCDQASANLTVRFREAERVTVEVVGADEQVVQTLATNQRVPRGNADFVWDGRTESGAVAADGLYRLRFDLARAGRTVLLPTTVRVDTQAPEVSVVSAGPPVISPDRDGEAERVRIRYRTNEQGTPVLRIAPGVTKKGKHRPAGRSTLAWGGTINGVPAPAGDYRLSLQIRDDAGNLSPPTDPVGVTVEYISLRAQELEATHGGVLSFEVTGQAAYSWQLIRPPRNGRPARTFIYVATETDTDVSAALPGQAQPGRYVLRVWRGGNEDSALVRIRRSS